MEVPADAAEGVTTCEAESLEGVLALLETHDDIDLVLLDLHMPGNHGLAGLAAVRAQQLLAEVVRRFEATTIGPGSAALRRRPGSPQK